MRTTILKKDVHPLALEVCAVLQQHGYQAFIVGGCVRDLLLEKTPKDWDICTDASPEQVGQIFQRTLPTGLQHGTVTVCMGEGAENHFEVTTFRTEGKYSDGRRPEVVYFVKKVEEDLARRDLTINAIAYDPIANRAVDPFMGIFDLKSEIIRAVGKPVDRFQEDGLRIMRVARFAARFGYKVDVDTLKGMQEALETLKKVSKERVADELRKTLMADCPSYGLLILLTSGALKIACPLLVSQFDPEIDSIPLYSRECFGALETRLAFLYYHVPVRLVKEELINLKMSNQELKRVIFLLETLSTFYGFKEFSSLLSYRKFIARIKNESPDPWEYTYQQFIELAKALKLPYEKLSFYEGEEVPSRKDMQINGDDLMSRIGVSPGPRVGKILEKCYQDILQYPEHNYKEYLIETVRKQLEYSPEYYD